MALARLCSAKLRSKDEGRGKGMLTLVTAVPPRKNTTSMAKKTLHGWITWITAVSVAVAIPAGVRDFLDQAR